MIISRLRDEYTATRRICDELYVMWGAARAEANDAYDVWSGTHDAEAYTVYLAAEDRADAAEREYTRACAHLPLTTA